MILTIDSENTGAQRNKAHWADPRNRSVIWQYKINDEPTTILSEEWEFKDNDAFNQTDWVVGFNLKYDLLWFRRYGVDLTKKKLWDVQLYHFIWNNQAKRYPSLNEVAERWGFEQKLDIVATEYWDCGLDTDDVPLDILSEYGAYDVDLTYNCMRKQLEEFKTLPPNLRKTILLAMEDLAAITDMEWNGINYDKERSLKLGYQMQERVVSLYETLHEVIQPPCPINFGSGEQVSAVLYGGTIKETIIEDYLFEYANTNLNPSDKRFKPPVMKKRKVTREHAFHRLVAPLKGSEMAKEGVWSTNEDTLRSLKPNKTAKMIIEILLEIRGLEKLIGTYFHGFPKRMDDMGWEDNVIHTNLSQVVTITGRLASDKPNMQNNPSIQKQCFVSRFKHKEMKR